MDPQEPADEVFRKELTTLIPQMRAFARSMCGDATDGDDLAQDGLLKALSAHHSYARGTNMKAWVFMILRNQFYSGKRRSWRQVQLDPEIAERTLVATTNVTGALELDEVRRALRRLPEEQREALILIGAGGFSYEEAAAMCACAIGTLKSRVSRARDRIALILAEASFGKDEVHPSAAMSSILDQLGRYERRARIAA
jgi:RNA polymerase sigma-70 factor (ECF subfamily)